MTWSTYEKRGFLRSIRSQATKSSQDLESTLLAVIEGRSISITQGRILISHSDGSSSTGYMAPGGKTIGNVMELASELMDRYEAARTIVEATGEVVNDDLIFTQMMSELNAFREHTNDYSVLGYYR